MEIFKKGVQLIGRITGSEKIPVSDGGDLPKAVTTEQLKDYIVRSVGGEENVQSDWSEENPDSDAYIKNKPIIPEDISEKINGDGTITKIVKVISMPSSPDPNTLYIVMN